MKPISRAYVLTAIALGLVTTSAFASPELGDKAPTLAVTGFVGPQPPSLPGDEKAKDHIFVIAVWASWHDRSLALLPMLHALHADHADKGVIVIAVSNEEAGDLAPHTKTDAAKPAYFGLDGNVGVTETWADDTDIPMVYVVSKDNIVAWKGDPGRKPGEIEQVLRKLGEGTFDLDAARNAEDNEKRYQDLTMQLQTAYAGGKQDEIFKIVNKMIALKPKELHPYLIKRQMIMQFAAYQRLPAHLSAIERAFADSAPDLNRIVDVELSLEPADRNPGFMVRCADRLRAVTKDRDPFALDMSARALAELGLHAEAIAAMEQAVALAPPGDERRPMEMRLAYYKAIERIRAERVKTPKTPEAPSAVSSKPE